MARQKFTTRRDAAFDCGSEWIVGNPSLTGLWKVGLSLGSDGQNRHQIPRRLPEIFPRKSCARSGLFIPQRDHGVDAHGAARGDVSGDECDGENC
jgi:hypothetical protein